MERLNRVLDKAIIVLSRNAYVEGSWSDLYIKRFIGLYDHPGNKILKEDPGEEKIGEGLTISEIVTMSDIDVVPKLPSLVK